MKMSFFYQAFLCFYLKKPIQKGFSSICMTGLCRNPDPKGGRGYGYFHITSYKTEIQFFSVLSRNREETRKHIKIVQNTAGSKQFIVRHCYIFFCKSVF